MRIYTKKAFGFVNPDPSKQVNGAREVVKTSPLGFHDVPEWVAEDDMFKWGKQDGDIEEIKVEVAVAGKDKASAPSTDDKKPEGWTAPSTDAAKGK